MKTGEKIGWGQGRLTSTGSNYEIVSNQERSSNRVLGVYHCVCVLLDPCRIVYAAWWQDGCFCFRHAEICHDGQRNVCDGHPHGCEVVLEVLLV